MERKSSESLLSQECSHMIIVDCCSISTSIMTHCYLRSSAHSAPKYRSTNGPKNKRFRSFGRISVPLLGRRFLFACSVRTNGAKQLALEGRLPCIPETQHIEWLWTVVHFICSGVNLDRQFQETSSPHFFVHYRDRCVGLMTGGWALTVHETMTASGRVIPRASFHQLFDALCLALKTLSLSFFTSLVQHSTRIFMGVSFSFSVFRCIAGPRTLFLERAVQWWSL